MPEPRHWYLLLYDVADDKRLKRTHKALRAWGQPVQLSVFRVRVTVRQLERLRFELARILSDDDRLMVARLCDGCASRVTVQGPELSSFDINPPPFLIL